VALGECVGIGFTAPNVRRRWANAEVGGEEKSGSWASREISGSSC
jgi:hypothetical protein